MTQDYHPIYVCGGYSVEDLKWKYTDKNGHNHYYLEDKSLPTLNRQVEIEMCCDYYGDEWEDETIWYECKQCGEVIKPGLIHKNEPLIQYGQTYYYIDDVQVTEETYMKKFKEELWTMRFRDK